MKKFILNEAAFSSSTALTKKNPNTVEFVAILQEADAPNRNGRIYPKRVLEEALNSPYVRERLATKSFFGECGHPLDNSVQRQMTIDFTNAAFMIKEVWWEGNLLKGKLETLDTALGRDMKGIIEQGSQVAFSLRAQGNVRQDPMTGKTIVESPLNICTYDYVINPSHQKAFIEQICNETCISMFRVSKENLSMAVLTESAQLFENGTLIDIEEQVESTVIDYTSSYTPKAKRLSEMYIPEEGDTILSLKEDVMIKNGNTVKKVCLEDYLVKDIRSRIARLGEDE